MQFALCSLHFALSNALRPKIDAAPSSPGAYLFKDSTGKIIYVGKARSLADRLRAYVGAQADSRHEALMSEAADVDLIATGSEVEALILEENLIKLNKPRYNVRLKDDKKFPYLKLTTGDPYPSLLVTRNLKPDGSEFFGPYTNAKDLRKAVRAARRIFRLRSCRKPLTPDKPQKACLNFHMKRCSGPCRGTEPAADYAARVKAVRAFLTGRNDELESELERLMWAASERADFETAAALRDQLFALRAIKPHAPITFGDKVPRDAIGIVLGERSAHATMLRVREGKLISKDDFALSVTRNATEAEVLETVLGAYYGHTSDIPDEILVPFAVESVEAFAGRFRKQRGAEVVIFTPDRGPRRRLLAMAQRNAQLEFSRREQLPRVPTANVELGKILGLASPPRRIEGVDISNISGRHAVGSIVVSSDARPLKTEYRRFRIRTVAGRGGPLVSPAAQWPKSSGGA